MTGALALIYEARDLATVRNSVLLVSSVSWIVLIKHSAVLMLSHCSPMPSGSMPLAASVQMLLTKNPPLNLAAGWALMLFAMMSLVMVEPIRHIRLRSFTHRRGRSISFFVTGYAAVWMALGIVLLAIETVIKGFRPESYLPAGTVILAALVWQLSPAKQICLNRCHFHSELAAFGAAADLDALRFGLTHGIWCAGSCWGLMLFPMLLPRGHIVALAVVAILIFSERLEQPGPPCWRWHGFGKFIRIVIAQTRISLDTRRFRVSFWKS